MESKKKDSERKSRKKKNKALYGERGLSTTKTLLLVKKKRGTSGKTGGRDNENFRKRGSKS